MSQKRSSLLNKSEFALLSDAGRAVGIERCNRDINYNKILEHQYLSGDCQAGAVRMACADRKPDNGAVISRFLRRH